MTPAKEPAAASASSPRPNPFALPSGTTLRFLVLLLAILLATIRFGPEWGTLMLGQGLGPDLTVSDACLGTLNRDVWPSPWVRLDDEVAAMQACWNATSGPVSLVKPSGHSCTTS